MKFKAFRETVTQVTKEVDNFSRACPRGYCPRASDLFPSRGLCPALRSPAEPERETICNRVNFLFFLATLYENLVSNSRNGASFLTRERDVFLNVQSNFLNRHPFSEDFVFKYLSISLIKWRRKMYV